MKKALSLLLSLLMLAALTVCGLTAIPSASASPSTEPVLNYPTRQITFVCPYDPGGAVDAGMRIVAAAFAEKTGQQCIVENIPGAGSMIGFNTVQQRPADGYTITACTGTANPWVMETMPDIPLAWKPSEFTLIGRAYEPPSSHGIIVKGGRWETLVDFINEVKSKPSKSFNFGLQGPGQLTDPVLMDFQRLVGVEFNIVYYPGANEVQTDIITGDIDAGIVSANRAALATNNNFRILTLLGDSVPADYPVQGIPLITEFPDKLGFKWSEQQR